MFKLIGPQCRNMFYFVTKYTYISVNIFITKVSRRDLYSNYMQSILIFSVLFFSAGRDLFCWFHGRLTVWKPSPKSQLSPNSDASLWRSHLEPSTWFQPLFTNTAPSLEFCLHPDSPQITLWESAAFQNNGLSQGCLLFTGYKSDFISFFPILRLLLYLLYWWMVLPSTHLT